MKNIDQTKIKVYVNVEDPSKGIYIAEYKGKKAYGDTEQIARLRVIDEITYPVIYKKWKQSLSIEFKGMDVTGCAGCVCPPSTLADTFICNEERKIKNIVENMIENKLSNLQVISRDEYADDYDD